MGEETSTITFESLYNMVRNEKINEAIQELNPKAYNQIVNYLKTKIQIYKDAKAKGESNTEQLKTQIVSARKLIKELYERRERKILQLAINKSRTKVADDSSLLKEEEKLFNEATEILNNYRKDILLNLVNSRLPYGIEEAPVKKEVEDATIRFIKHVPKFLNTNMEVLGPFNEGDIAKLPKKIAKVIVDKEHADYMS